MVDTGACYGGDLSAYCPETGEIRRVPGQRRIPLSLTLATVGHRLESCLP
jgi:hypothetical protein